jgi:hypothetical protein
MPRKPPSRPRSRTATRQPGAGASWVGGRFSLPAYVNDGEPFRPEVVMWLDLEHDVIRAFHLDRPPLGRSVIAASLEQAINAPLGAAPGNPRRVRVPDAELAAIAREVLPPGVEVEVGPVDELTPAVDDLGRVIAAGPPPARHRDENDDEPQRRGRASARSKRGATARDDEDEGYLCSGRVRPEVVARLFDATARLAAAAPWRRTDDDVVLAVDIPAFGLDGACLSIIGSLGENLGFVLFDSAASFEAFLGLEETMDSGDRRAPVRVRGYLLSLSLARWGELPPAMRREAREHGWSVSDPRGYPELLCLDPDGVPRPNVERDYRLAAVCAAALAEFCATFEGDLDPPPHPPARRTIATNVSGEDVSVTLTLPHPATALHADLDTPAPSPPRHDRKAQPRVPIDASHDVRRVDEPSLLRGGTAAGSYPRELAHAPEPMQRAWPRVGRNDPCPCGSGRKFKRCHGDTVATDHGAASVLDQRAERAGRWHERDRRLLQEMLEVAKLRFADGLRDVVRAAERLAGDDGADAMLPQWISYHARFGDRPLAARFMDVRGSYLTRADRDWLVAECAAWLSIWEVAEVVPGRGMELRDLLTGERRTIVETSASRLVVRFDAILARVVSIEDLSLLCGVHPRILKPRPTDEVVRAVRRRLRLGTKPVAPERLRSEEATKTLLDAWGRTVASEVARVASREVCNTDGHRLLLTTDRFRFAAACRDEVAERLATVAVRADAAATAGHGTGDGPSDPAGGRTAAGGTIHLTVSRSADVARTGLDTVVIARLAVHHDVVVAETNSRERADEIRALVERTCAGLVEHAGRAHSDPSSPAVRAQHDARAEERAEEDPPPEALAALLALKQRHYEAWLDAPLPVLDGRTPREASRTAAGRRELAVLLRDIENTEARSPEGQRFDASGLWHELGIASLR